MPMSEADEKLVRVVLDNPDASSEQLTEALGWKDQAWQHHFANCVSGANTFFGPSSMPAVRAPGCLSRFSLIFGGAWSR